MTHTLRCAVYTRVSNDDRLHQEFHSIAAQKEAGLALILSQRSEGWVTVLDDYDDAGFSGAHTERPALKRLLADIQADLIDMVVVYKIDRLSRSLADFSKMVELFDRHEVSFVSVTQQLNTRSSMGRLMLHVLLSFAQFEREVTGERIRDKVAASKKKGLWMGGIPPLGYTVHQQRLLIEPKEAGLVRRIFEDMLSFASPTQIVAQLHAQGYTTKAWLSKQGHLRPGGPIDKKYLHRLLRNRVYLGETLHKGACYPNTHEAIITQDLWDQVQAILAKPPQKQATRKTQHALLRGLLYDEQGRRLYPTYTRKKGKVYRYYISKEEQRFGSSIRQGKTRLPATALEEVVIQQVFNVLCSPEVMEAMTRQGPLPEDQIVLALKRLHELWPQFFIHEQIRLLHLLIQRIDVKHEGIRIHWHPLGWQALLQEFQVDRIGHESLEQAS